MRTSAVLVKFEKYVETDFETNIIVEHVRVTVR